jgi:nicotinate-nucleotide pyrophosphorylase (carboxylating)
MNISSTQSKEKSQAPASRKDELLEALIALAIEEDLGGDGDITTKATVPEKLKAECTILCKEPAVVAGLGVARAVFARFDKDIEMISLVDDGAWIGGDCQDIATIKGPAGAILSAERLVLNLMQRMSGVATTTRKFVELTAASGIKVLDTRKTTPGMRQLQREAVRIGGGTNHRFGLFDAILIKDNHVHIAGGVAKAVQLARHAYPDKRIEVEVTNLEEVGMALAEKADAILLDNMTPALIEESVKLINKQAWIEVSGGIALDTIVNYLIPGVDAISCGALTHSAPNIDLSLEVVKFYE